MADTGKPADKSGQASQVRDSSVPDARPGAATTTRPTPSAEAVVSSTHPLGGEPLSNVQHADRAVPPETTTHRPTPLKPKDRERFEELRSKEPNPDVLPPNVRTEAEEHEYRKLAKLVADAERQAAMEAARPEIRPSPKDRLAELKKRGRHLGEGETIELRRIEALLKDEARVEELKKMDKRVPEEDDELNMTMQRVAEARAAGGFDPNG